ncbi:MAG TPA: glycosyltransferase 87 family protein [Terracidiphilus sp.]|nr:glycosyltransferase 87 family protein [Terracidiphilus sp.]
MNKERRIAAIVLLLCGVFLVLLSLLYRDIDAWSVDFKAVYYAFRYLALGHDLYNPARLAAYFLSQNQADATSAHAAVQTVSLFDYPPTAFAFFAPFALLPFKIAAFMWRSLMVLLLAAASMLMWEFGSPWSPRVSLILAGLLLANCVGVFALGNPAGIVIGLVVLCTSCFFSNRYVLLGEIGLAVVLSIKPHDAGMVWLFFLLAGGTLRKRALRTLGWAVILWVPGILWTTAVASHWPLELRANLHTVLVQGGENSPGPDSPANNTVGQIIGFQAVASVFRDQPGFYGTMTAVIVWPLIGLWIWVTLRSRFSIANGWLALASASALTMLPVYHRLYDAKLILLAIPACAMLWARRGLLGWLALVITSGAFVLTADLPNVLFAALVKSWHIVAGGWLGKVETILFYRSATLALLAMGVFYLVVYARSSNRHEVVAET